MTEPLRPDDPTVLLPGGGGGDTGAGGVDASLESGPSLVDQRVVEAAIRRGLISAMQASSVLESLPARPLSSSQEASSVAALDSLVARGLVSAAAAKELEDEVKNDFVPGYRLLGELGRGGMGVVYRALQKRLDRTVALKVVNPGAARDPDYLRRFDQEARALAKLNHPNIVQVYDGGETAGKVYLALEFIEGPDALKALRQHGPMGEAQALRVARDAAQGLGHALAAGIIHRDVKPANLMLVDRPRATPDDRWVAKVTDLGLARPVERGKHEAETTKAGTILGSPAYMAPEQANGEPADFRSDIYALGATVYHLVTGKAPYDADSAIKVIVKKQTEQLEDPRAYAPKLSDGLVRVLDRCLARPPEERYRSYEALVEDLERVLRGEAPATPPVPRDASSLRLGRPTGRLAPEGVQPAAASGGGASGGRAFAIIAGAIVVSGGLSIALAWKRTPNDLGLGFAGTTEVEAPASDPAARMAATLDALASLAPADALEPRRLGEAKALLAAVPEVERGPLELRLASVVGKALDAAAGERIASIEAALARADYAALAAGVSRAVEPYRLLERDLPPRLLALSGVAAKAGGPDGAAEREAWAAAEAAQDPLAVIAALETFEQRFPWSPALEQARAKLAAATAGAPEVTLRAVPASARLTLDGKPLPPGDWKGRLAAGKHTVSAEAPGHFVEETSFEATSGLALALRLSPQPERPLVEDKDRAARVYSPFKAAHAEWPDQAGQWVIVRERGGALQGEPPREGAWGTARRDLTPPLTQLERLDGRWQLYWECVPAAGARAELRLVGDGAGRAIAVGVKDGEAYLLQREADGAETPLERCPLVPGADPVFTADWDGKVLLVRYRRELLGSVRVAWTPSAPPSIEAAVLGAGKSDFRAMELRALVETGAR